MNNSKVLSTLRIEGGYGVSGTRQLVPYNALSMYSTNGCPLVEDDIQAYYKGMNRVRSSEYNATIKAAFMNDRISVSATYYDRKIKDAMSLYCFGRQKSENVSTWISAPMTETASYNSCIVNRGVEIDLGAFAIRNSRSELEIHMNAAYNFNNILEIFISFLPTTNIPETMSFECQFYKTFVT